MDVALEKSILKLLQPNNEAISEGMCELKTSLSDPTQAVTKLCQLMSLSSCSQVRQYASVLLRRRLLKAKCWTKLPQPIRDGIKEDILKVLVNECDTSVRNSIAYVVATVAKFELNKARWPVLLQFLSDSMLSSNVSQRQIGVYTLSIVSLNCQAYLLKHASSIVSVFTQLLVDTDASIQFYTIQTVTNLLPSVDSDSMKHFKSLSQAVLHCTYTLCSATFSNTQQQQQCVDTQAVDRAVQTLDVLIEYVSHEIEMITSERLVQSVRMCVTLFAETRADLKLRAKASHCLEEIVRNRKTVICRNKLIHSILETCVSVLCSTTDDSTDSDSLLACSGEADLAECEGDSLLVSCTRLIDAMAISLPPEKLLTPLTRLVEPLISSSDVYQQRAALLSLCMTAEGCSEYIRSKYLHTWVTHISVCVQHTSAVVHNAAFFAIGQLAEYLQSDIGKYSDVLMPILCKYLADLLDYCQKNGTETHASDRMFYALSRLCEILDDKILTYLECLLQSLLAFVGLPTATFPHTVEMSLGALSAVSSAADHALTPYFTPLMSALQRHLVTVPGTNGAPADAHATADDSGSLQSQALDTLAVMIRCFDHATIRPHCIEIMELTISLLQSQDDPIIARSAYTVFASVGSVIGNDMSVYMARIVECMLECLRSTDGVGVEYKDGSKADNGIVDIFETISNDYDNVSTADSDEEFDDGKAMRYEFENSYFSEKEEALNTIKALAKDCSKAFLPHLENCFYETHYKLNHDREDIRKAAVDTMAQLCVTSQLFDDNKCTLATLSVFVPTLHEFVQIETSCTVLMAAMDGYAYVLKHLKALVLHETEHLELILGAVRDILAYKALCQHEVDDIDDAPEDSEYDEMLIEFAADVIPSLGYAMPTQQFVKIFVDIYPTLLLKTKATKSESEQAFAVGCIAGCVEFLGREAISSMLPDLYAVFMRPLACYSSPASKPHDVFHDLVNNAVFGLGELLFYADITQSATVNLPNVLNTLSTCLGSTPNCRVKDNVCGAIMRFIMARLATELDAEMFQGILANLPLSEDYAENQTLIRCFLFLYRTKHPLFQQHMIAILTQALLIYNTKKSAEGDTDSLIREFITQFKQEHSENLKNVVNSLPNNLVITFAGIN